MRCPSCGFVSFDHLTACKKCGKELPPPPGGRRMPAPAAITGLGGLAQPAAARAQGLETFLGAADPTTETLVTGGPAPGPAARSASPEDTFSFTLPSAAAPPPPRGTLFEPAAAAREIEADLRPAGFWIRFVAALVDGLILGIVTYVVTMAMGLRGLSVTPGDPGAMFMDVARQATLQSSVSMLIGLLYSVGFVGSRGQTPGKILLKLKIIRADGGEVDYVKAFIRWIGYLVSALPLFIGYIMAGFTTNKRALHDLIAGTRVIRL